MPVELLDPRRVAALRAAPLTYSEVGHTLGEHPSGYQTVDRTVTLPATVDFDTAAGDLFHWQVQHRAGLRVAASSELVQPESVVVLRFGWLPVRAACRVVYTLAEPRRCGFAYGTLPGHPETGEEAFVLRHQDDGGVTLTIRAFSRPWSIAAKAAGPLGRVAQNAMTRRYLRALVP